MQTATAKASNLPSSSARLKPAPARRGRPLNGSIRPDGTQWVGAVESIQTIPSEVFAHLAEATTNVVCKVRYLALERLSQGNTLSVVAAEFNVSTQSVSQWAARYRDGGAEMLESMQGSVALASAHVSPETIRELAAGCEDTTRRTALLALADVVAGKNAKDVSSSHRFVHTQFVAWVERFNELGLAGLREDMPTPAFRLPPIVMRPDHDLNMLNEAMQACGDEDHRMRIGVIAMLYRGLEPGEIAAAVGTTTTHIRKWSERFNLGGVDAIAPSRGVPELRADYDAQRVAAIGEASDDLKVKRKCVAIRQIYEGRRKIEIAREAGITRAGLHLWIGRFNGRGESWLLGEVVKPWAYKKAACEGSQTPTIATEIDADGIARLTECLLRCSSHPEPVSVQMVKTWIRMELDVHLDIPAVEQALGAAGYGILRKQVVAKAVSDRYENRKAARERNRSAS